MASGTKREKLVSELKELNFYWEELSAGKSEEELEKLIFELKTARKTIKNIFKSKIMGKVDEEGE